MKTETREHDDLPILDEIGHDLSAAFAREERVTERRRRSRRLRRIAVATAALFVVVPGSVVATRYIWAPQPGELAPQPFGNGKPIQIAEGSTAVASWRISAYMSDRGVCWQVAQFTEEESFGLTVNCLSDFATDERMSPSFNLGGEEARYFGWAPPAAARVTATDDEGRALPAQIVKAPPDRVERAGLPRGLRFYVVTGPPLGERSEPPAIAAFNAAGREIDRFPPKR
jgi:hypothetical protein